MQAFAEVISQKGGKRREDENGRGLLNALRFEQKVILLPKFVVRRSIVSYTGCRLESVRPREEGG